MADKGYVLTADDVRTLRELLDDFRSMRLNSQGRRRVAPPVDYSAPEMYVAFTPSDGIPALIQQNPPDFGPGDVPGFAVCQTYQVLETGGTIPQLWATTAHEYTVYNMTLGTVPGGIWVPIWRDKWGKWWTMLSEAGSGTGTGTGTSRDVLTPIEHVDIITAAIYVFLLSDSYRCKVFNAVGTTMLAYLPLPSEAHSGTGSGIHFSDGHWIDIENIAVGYLVLWATHGCTINGKTQIVVQSQEGGRLLTNGLNWYFITGRRPAGVRVVGNVATDTITLADNGYLVSYEGNVDCDVSVSPSIFPDSFQVDVENTEAFKLVKITSGAGQVIQIPFERGETLFGTGTATLGGNPGNCFFPGREVINSDCTIGGANISELTALDATAIKTVTFDAGVLGYGWGGIVSNFGADVIELGGVPIDGEADELLHPGEGIMLVANPDETSLLSFRGMYFTNVQTLTGSTYTYTPRDRGFLTRFVPTAGVNPLVTIPSNDISDRWYTFVYCGTRGSFVTLTDDSGQEIYVGYGRGTHLIRGDGSNVISGNPGQTLGGHDTYNADADITWYHNQRGVVLAAAADHVMSLKDSTFNEFFSCDFRNEGPSVLTIAAPIIATVQKKINGQNTWVVPPCQSVHVTCDGAKYSIYPGQNCIIPTDNTVSKTIYPYHNQTAQNLSGTTGSQVLTLDTTTKYSGFNFEVYNNSTQDWNITPSSGNINGSGTVVVKSGGSARVSCDGSNYFCGTR